MSSGPAPSAPTAVKVRSLPVERWPLADQQAWATACRPSQRLARGGTGAHLKAVTLCDLARRYGYYLDFLGRRGLLDLRLAAGALVTPENVKTFVQELNNRVGSVTVYGSIYKLRRASQLLNPKGNVAWLTEVEKDLALVMQPRSKSDRLVLTEVLVETGLTLINEADSSPTLSKLGKARQIRNGLMVAMLALHPIRLKNFASLEIGHNFIAIEGSWWITLSAADTKEKRPDERRIDELLKTALTLYLGEYRPMLQGNDSKSNALWLSSHDGAPMTYDGIARAVTETTRFAVGAAVSPHLFRTAVASSAAMHGGANPHLGSALLHHIDHRVTEAHYNRASSLSAAQSFRAIVKGYIKDHPG
jgi:site-specific recombinase XerD